MSNDVISDPFASSINPCELYDVTFKIAVPRTLGSDVTVAYGSLDLHHQQLLTAVQTEIDLAQHGAVLEPQERAIAPYLFATLLGSTIKNVAASQSTILTNVWPNVRSSGRGGNSVHGALVSQVLAEPLASRVRLHPSAHERVIIHLDVKPTRAVAHSAVVKELNSIKDRLPGATIFDPRPSATHPYVFAEMTGYAILALVDLDRSPLTQPQAIYRIWEDAQVSASITDSISTIKADAAHVAFAAVGKGIVWAVLDSGIDGSHPHFERYSNLTFADDSPLSHKDCRLHSTRAAPVVVPQSAKGPCPDDSAAVSDAYGHGTHVAGIIAGGMSTQWPTSARARAGDEPLPSPDVAVSALSAKVAMQKPVAVVTTRNEAGVQETRTRALYEIAGMAPQCKVVSLRVLDDDGTGNVSSLINAIDQIQQWNDGGRSLTLHGVNISVGYPFEAEWFACGQSPLCIEVDRLVSSGVVVVVSAGNTGYGYVQTQGAGPTGLGLSMSISDPGNSELAITVGSTHRTAPHRYGVSFFSSKGPTGDGRLKPDLLAPGERIISCASAQSRTNLTIVRDNSMPPAVVGAEQYQYREDSGTSMAAPHVSGIIAAFLSIRREYIGRPRDVKSIFMAAATDLGRDRAYQGAGLVDLMRSIQSV